MAANLSTKKVIYAALAGNLLVATTKGGAAVWTGSSAMLSETVHSFVDTLNELLLLYGFTGPADVRTWCTLSDMVAKSTFGALSWR